MKIINRIVSILLILTIILPLLYTTVLALSVDEIKYLALGDSIAFGYGLDNIPEDSYAQVVRKKYGILESNFSNLAVSGMTCAEFYDTIQTNEYTKAIEKANLITVSIGSNEILGIAVKAISDATGIEINAKFPQEVKEYIKKLSVLEKASLARRLYNSFTSDDTQKEVNKSIEVYREKWKKSIEYIKSINPEVSIIATQFYNPYYEISLGTWDLGSFVDVYIKKMNNILEEQSNSEEIYKIARIYNDFNTTDPRITNVYVDISNLDKIDVDPHPNKEGHSIIATRILDVLETLELNKEPISKKNIQGLTFNDIEDYDYTGLEIKPQVIIKDGDKILAENIDYTLTYSNNIEVGKASIIINGIGNYTGTVIKSFNIKNVSVDNIIDINNMTILDISQCTYTGIKITPDVEIISINGAKLTKNVDYTLRYYDNIDAGIGKIEITGIGNYKGTKQLNFKIVPKSIVNATIEEVGEQKYTGEEIRPNIRITDGSAKLIENKDYTISYSNNIEVGNAVITITGKGNYTDTASITFKIVEEKIYTTKDIRGTDASKIEDKIYTGKLITPEVDIMDGNTKLIKNKDYQLSYENNLNAGVGKVIIYGIGDYTNEITIEFNIIRKNINFTQIADIKDQIYNGNSIRPELIITSDSIKLKENEDYIIEYSNNTNVGTASITIIGINNYDGTAVKTFNIVSNEDKQKEDEQKEDNQKENIDNNNSVDNTVLTDKMPYTGIKSTIFVLISCFIVLGIINWFKYYKNQI